MRRAVGVVLVVLTALNVRCKDDNLSTEGRPLRRQHHTTEKAKRAKRRATAVPSKLQTRRREPPRRRCENPFVPQWHVGQVWRVKYVFTSSGGLAMANPAPDVNKLTIEYRVVAKKRRGNRIIAEVRLFDDIGRPFSPIECINFDEDSFTVQSHGRVDSPEANPAPFYPVLGREYASLSTVSDFGSFCSVSWDSVRSGVNAKERRRLMAKHGPRAKRISHLSEVPATPPFVQEILFSKHKGDKREMTVRLIATEELKGKGMGKNVILMEQIWEQDRPWWSHLHKKSTLGVSVKGELVIAR